MLYPVRMDVNLPHDLSVAQPDDLKAPENAYAQQLPQEGKKTSGSSSIASSANTPTTASSTWNRTTPCTRCSWACRSSRT